LATAEVGDQHAALCAARLSDTASRFAEINLTAAD